MKQSKGVIERVYRVNADFQRLELALESDLGRIKPGHSLLVQSAEGVVPYLRQRWWPVDINGEHLVVERPINETYETTQVVDALGLVGEPYRFRRNLHNVLLVAHDTPPTPLLMTIPWLMSNNISVTMVLTGSARRYATGHLDERLEIIQGESDFTWADQVMTVGWADQVFVVVDDVDELAAFRQVVDRFEDLRATLPTNYLFGVFRPALPCGAGACNACMLRLRKGDVLACTDGPAFDLTQLVS